MKKIAILSSRIPWPLDKGDKLRLYHQIKSLSHHFKVHLISLTDSEEEDPIVGDLLTYCSDIIVLRLPKKKSYRNMVSSYFSKRPMQVAYFYDRDIHREIAFRLSALQPDAIYCQLVRMAEYCPSDIPAILDIMDAGGLNDLARTYQTSWWRSIMLKTETTNLQLYEAHVANRFAKQTIISERDKLALHRSIQENVQVLPNGVMAEIESFYGPYDTQARIGFLGNLSYRHNQLAIDFIIDNILPSIDKSITIAIAGAGHYSRLEQPIQGIEYLGYVDSIGQYYKGLDLLIAPIFSGSGIQNKVLEAMIYKLPVVTTSFVNDAIKAPANCISLAEDLDSFKQVINSLISQPEERERQAVCAHEYVKEHFNWARINQKLISLFEELLEV